MQFITRSVLKYLFPVRYFRQFISFPNEATALSYRPSHLNGISSSGTGDGADDVDVVAE